MTPEPSLAMMTSAKEVHFFEFRGRLNNSDRWLDSDRGARHAGLGREGTVNIQDAETQYCPSKKELTRERSVLSGIAPGP